MKLRVLLADDHTMFRQALRMALETTPDIEVVGETADGRGVLQAVAEYRPDVVCMDLTMPGLDGIEATRQLLVAHPGVKVIGLSCHVERQRVTDMLEAGALGYVVKMTAGSELIPAIRAVSLNQTYFSAELDIADTAELHRLAGGAKTMTD